MYEINMILYFIIDFSFKNIVIQLKTFTLRILILGCRFPLDSYV